jgi:hypothetical protein
MQGTEKETPSTGKEATPKSEGLRTEAKPKIKQNCQLIEASSTNLAVKARVMIFRLAITRHKSLNHKSHEGDLPNQRARRQRYNPNDTRAVPKHDLSPNQKSSITVSSLKLTPLI